MPRRERFVPAYKQRRQECDARPKARSPIGLGQAFGPPLLEALGLTGMPRVLALQFECVAGQVATVTIRQAMTERQKDRLCELLRTASFRLMPEASPPPGASSPVGLEPFEPRPPSDTAHRVGG